MAAVFFIRDRRHRLSVWRRSRRDSSRIEDNDSMIRARWRPRKALPTTRWSTTCSRWPTSCARIRMSTRSWRSAGGTTATTPPLLDAVEAAQDARVGADAGHRRAAAQAIAISRGDESSWSLRRAMRFGGHQTKSAYDFTLQGPDTAELYAQAQKLRTRDREAARPGRTSPPTCRSRIRT